RIERFEVSLDPRGQFVRLKRLEFNCAGRRHQSLSQLFSLVDVVSRENYHGSFDWPLKICQQYFLISVPEPAKISQANYSTFRHHRQLLSRSDSVLHVITDEIE